MATEQQKSVAITGLPNSSLVLSIDIPETLKNEFESHLGNGFKKDLVEALEKLYEISSKLNADLVAENAKENLEKINKYDKNFINKDAYEEIAKETLKSVAAVICHQPITEMDKSAEEVINVLDIQTSNTKDKPKIEVDIADDDSTQATEIVKTSNDFYQQIRQPLVQSSPIRSTLLSGYSVLQINKKMVLRYIIQILFIKKLAAEMKRAVAVQLERSRFQGDSLFEWNNLAKIPSKADFENIGSRWICVEYKSDRKSEIINWTKNTVDFVLINDLESPYIAVLADYWKFKDYEVPALIGEFAGYGASFEDFPEGSKDFKDALERLERKLTGK